MNSFIPIYEPYITKQSLIYAHNAIDSSWLSSKGEFLLKTQEKLQDLLNIKHILLLNNGTSATHLVSKALKFKYPKIKNIIAPNNVYVAAWNSFLFDKEYNIHTIDADINTWNIDECLLDKFININNKKIAILVVHNIGNIINVPKLKNKYTGIPIVEDNCEGFLGMHENTYSGTQSLASSISFFGNKNITCGEGGAFITNDTEIYEYIKCVHGQGQSSKKFIHNILGTNYRMTNVQAAILLGQLEILPEILEKKSKVFELYRAYFKNHDKIIPQSISIDTQHSNWMFGVRVIGSKGYDHAENFFNSHNIEIRPMFYPASVHEYLKNIHHGKEDMAKLLNKECIILPSYAGLTKDKIMYICKILEEYLLN